jgi:SAM-dependent methyltransferase
MSEFWEDMFQKIGLIWQFEPADSTIFTRDLFVANGLQKILIPGVGYGRNARLFVENGFDITGIEISETAIKLAQENGLDFPIHYGSVIQMPFDDSVYDGIYSYALIHLLNQRERGQFLKNCCSQLRTGGIMVFVVVSKGYTKLYGKGQQISKDRFRIPNGLNVFFYDSDSIEREFGKFGLVEYCEIDEPVKHLKNEEPIKFWRVFCRKSVISSSIFLHSTHE